MSEVLHPLRARIVAEAESWLGTPFVHAAEKRGVGIDCLSLLAAVGRAAGVLPATFTLPPVYPRAWAMRDNRYLELLLPYLAPRAGDPEPGDVALFRAGSAARRAPRPRAAHGACHGTVVKRWPIVIHADEERGFVVESHAFMGGTPGPFVCALTPRALLEVAGG